MSRSSKAVTPDAVTTMMRGDSLGASLPSGSASFARRWFRDVAVLPAFADAMDAMDAVDAPGAALSPLRELRARPQ